MMKTILLIDYDPQSIERVRRLLSRTGYQTAVARNGIAGIRAFERLKPDLTLVEGLLPRKHGFEVCRELKSTFVGRYSPVVVIAGPGTGLKQELRMTGCDAFLEKPYSDDALLAAVRKFTGNGKRIAAVAKPHRATPRVLHSDSKLDNLDRPARPVPPPRPEIPVTFAEEDIMAKLDAILPGGLQEASSVKTCDSKLPRVPNPVQAKEAPRPLLKRKKKTMSRRKRRTGPKGRQRAENVDAPRRAMRNGRPIKRSAKKSLARKKRSGVKKKKAGVRERTVRASSG